MALDFIGLMGLQALSSRSEAVMTGGGSKLRWSLRLIPMEKQGSGGQSEEASLL